MRVSKETAVLLKDAGYDVKTLYEAADKLRSKGVHVCVFVSVDRKTGSLFWYFELIDLKSFKYIREGVGALTFSAFESAYEAGIVYGLKYINNENHNN